MTASVIGFDDPVLIGLPTVNDGPGVGLTGASVLHAIAAAQVSAASETTAACLDI
jgi:hypothetical protein